MKFREIYSDLNLEDKKLINPKEFNLYKVKLNKGDMLFVPSFYFRQSKSNEDMNSMITYKFKSHSRLLDSYMISLFDNLIINE